MLAQRGRRCQPLHKCCANVCLFVKCSGKCLACSYTKIRQGSEKQNADNICSMYLFPIRVSGDLDVMYLIGRDSHLDQSNTSHLGQTMA